MRDCGSGYRQANDLKKIRDNLDSSINLETKFNRGDDSFRGKKNILGDYPEFRAAKIVLIQKGSRFWLRRVNFEYCINLVLKSRSLKQNSNIFCSLTRLYTCVLGVVWIVESTEWV